MGFAIAFFYTAAATLLLADFEVKALPWVYIFSGIVGYIIWYLSSRLEKRYSFSGLMKIYLGFLTISVLLFAIAISIFHSPWISFLMYIWIRVFVFIVAVVFWGMAARLFNLRQGKRLFGLISSGEVLSNIIGFFSIPLLMKFIITPNLVTIAFVSLVFCFIFLVLILNRFKEQFRQGGKARVIQETTEKKSKPKLTQNKYFKLLFIMALLPMFSMYFVDYFFLAQTKAEFLDKQVLASFLGLFLGFSAAAEFVVKTFFSGRLISKYGIKLGLLALPVLMLFSTFLASLSGTFYGVTAMFFSFVLMTKLFERAVRSSLNDPSFQILYQPLPPENRLFYQFRIEGIPKALGNTLAGLVLLLMTSISTINLVHFNYVFIFILVFWIKIAIDQYKEYRKTLENVIKKQKGNEEKVSNINTEILSEGILHSDIKYFSSLFNIVEKCDAASVPEILKNVLSRSKEEDFSDYLQKIRDNKILQAIDVLEDMLENNEQCEPVERNFRNTEIP
jgi:AAA family ATP:ADP antiporter